MARHFLVESVDEIVRGRDWLLRFFGLLALTLVLTFVALVAQASAQMAFPKSGDALAKFKWEQVTFQLHCRVGRVRAVNFNNLTPAQKAELAQASEEQVIADIKKRCMW